MRLSTFLRDIGRTVAYQPGLAPLLGGCVPTVLFCQLFWWTPEEGDGWFGKTTDEIMEATGLTMSELRAARAALSKRGLIQEKVKGSPPKLWFRIDLDRLDYCWEHREQIIAEMRTINRNTMEKARLAALEKRGIKSGSTLSNAENSILSNTENSTLNDTENQGSVALKNGFSATLRDIPIDKKITISEKEERQPAEALSVPSTYSVLVQFYGKTVTGQAAIRRLEDNAIQLENLKVTPEELRQFLLATTLRPVQFVVDNLLLWREQQRQELAKKRSDAYVGGQLPEYLQMQSAPKLALVPQPAIDEPAPEIEAVRTVWDDVLGVLERSISPEAFATWFRPTRFLAQDGNCLKVQVPDAVFDDWIWNNYADELEGAMREAGLSDCVVEFVVAERKAA